MEKEKEILKINDVENHLESNDKPKNLMDETAKNENKVKNNNGKTIAKSCKTIARTFLYFFWFGLIFCVLYGTYRLALHDSIAGTSSAVSPSMSYQQLQGMYEPVTITIIVIGVVFLIIIEVLSFLLIFKTKMLDECYKNRGVGRLWLLFALGVVCIVTSVYGAYLTKDIAQKIIKKSKYDNSVIH